MSSIKRQMLSGIAYTAVLKYSGLVVTLVVTAILARLLTPSDFGIVAVASVIISFFSIFTDMGISAAIVQRKDLSQANLSDLFSFSFYLGVFLAGFFFVLAPLIASYYNSTILQPICKLLSINLFFAAINIVPNALFYRDKNFKYIAIRGVIIQLVVGIAAIVFALLGGGLYALLINPIFSSLFLFILSIRVYPQKLSLTLGLSTLRIIFPYSAYQFMFNTINYFSRNIDKLLIGRYLSMPLLGYYEKSYRLMMLPLQNITHVITPVMHPILSAYQNDKRGLAVANEKIARVLSIVGFPLSVFLFFTAKELVLILFGTQWYNSIPVFKLLTLSVGIQMIMSSSGAIFQAAGDTKSLFISGLFSSTINVLGIVIGIFIFKTLEAIAVCICITFTLSFIQCYVQMYYVTLKQSLFSFAKILLAPLLLSLLLMVILLGLNSYLQHLTLFFSFFTKLTLSLFVVLFYIQLAGIVNVKEQVIRLIEKIK